MQFLAQAIAVRRSKLFTDSVKWTQEAFRARSVDDSDLLTSLCCMREVIETDLPEAVTATASDYIGKGIERIEKAVETSEPFEECDPKTEEQILNHAWGIWSSRGKTDLVRLRFTGYKAVRRLRESVWHPDEKVDGPDDYSYATWEAPIAEWREMLPWIRGWGADVVVLEPEKLRVSIEREVKDLRPVQTIRAGASLFQLAR